MSAAFCGVEVLSREVRGGTVDKWNNMLGACRSLLPRRYTHTRTEHEQDHFACHLGVMPAPVQIGWVPDFGAGFLDGSAGCVGNLGKGPGMMASVSVSLRCTQPKRMQCRGGVRAGGVCIYRRHVRRRRVCERCSHEHADMRAAQRRHRPSPACASPVRMPAQGCMNFAAISYVLDLLTNRNKDPFEQALSDPTSVDKDMLTKQKTNAKS